MIITLDVCVLGEGLSVGFPTALREKKCVVPLVKATWDINFLQTRKNFKYVFLPFSVTKST